LVEKQAAAASKASAREAQELELQKRMQDRQWGFVVATLAAHMCFAMSYVLRGHVVASLPAWACVLLTLAVARVVDWTNDKADVP
jgi:hypothetical protein